MVAGTKHVPSGDGGVESRDPSTDVRPGGYSFLGDFDDHWLELQLLRNTVRCLLSMHFVSYETDAD